MSEWHHVDFTTPGGNRIQAEIRNGSGPPLILIPGTWGNALTRARFVESLNPDIRLVCLALAGQDDNWPPPLHPSIPLFSDDVLSLAGRLELGSFFVGGNSLGGMIAIDMLRFGPERIRGAISIEGWTNWAVVNEAFNGDTSNTLTAIQAKFLQQVRRQLLDRWDPPLRDEYGTMWQRWDGEDILANTVIPVLEIWGDRGRPRPVRKTMRIPDRANISVEWISNASHNLLIEAPEHLARLTNDFIVAQASRD